MDGQDGTSSTSATDPHALPHPLELQQQYIDTYSHPAYAAAHAQLASSTSAGSGAGPSDGGFSGAYAAVRGLGGELGMLYGVHGYDTSGGQGPSAGQDGLALQPLPAASFDVAAVQPPATAPSAAAAAPGAPSTTTSAPPPAPPVTADAGPAPTSSSTSSSLPTPRPLSGPGSRQRWTPAEDAELIRLVKQLPPLTWTEIGQQMGRKGGGCGMRWYKVVRDRLAKEEEAKRKEAEANGEMPAATAVPSQVAPPLPPSFSGAIDPSLAGPSSLTPSASMTVGSSTGASASSGAPALDPSPRSGRKVVSSSRTGVPVAVETTLPLPSLPPSASQAGHPFPLPPAASVSTSTAPSGAVHANAKSQYLPDAALVSNPPVPFGPNTVLRGRRTKAPDTLAAELAIERGETSPLAPPAPAVAQPGGTSAADGQGEGEGEKKKVKKRGNKVHECPAENCTAAFKRPEHLRRHYKSVHRGEKPWPCVIEGCGKSFSRKDNLQQHQALVHSVRATYTYPDGTVSAEPPSPTSAASVITSFETVEVKRTASGGPKISRARQKASSASASPVIDALPPPPVPGPSQPLPHAMANTVVGLMSLSHGHGHGLASPLSLPSGGLPFAPSTSASASSVAAFAGEKRPFATDGTEEDAMGGIDKRLRLTAALGDGDPERDAALQMLATASSSSSASAAASVAAALGREGVPHEGRSITPSQEAVGLAAGWRAEE
ncbi:hypothetical protein JCM10213_001603 [Rhodosporidiobolus nylandii]